MYLLAGICTDPGYLTGTVATMVATALELMVLLLALFYMAAQLFKKPEWEGFVSIEMHQLLVSVLIFLFVFGAAWFACDIANAFAISATNSYALVPATPGGDQFTIAQGYLNYVTNGVALPMLVNLEQMRIVMQWFSSVSFRWGLTVWGAVVPGFPSFVLLERVIDFLLMLLTPFVSSLTVQEIGLQIISGTMLPYVLPAGVVLRIFPPTRDAGSFLIVSAIAFQIVFPFTYVMDNEVVGQMMQYDAAVQASGQGVYQQQAAAYPTLMSADDDTSSGPSFTLAGTFTSVMSLPTQLLELTVGSLTYIILQAVFLPALSITITIAFIRGTLKFVSQKLD